MSARRNAADCCGVVHVARAIFDAQDVAGLRHMSEQRIVAAVLPMMRIEAAEGPGDRGASAHDGAVDIESESRQVQPDQRVQHEVLVEPDQRAERLLRDAPQPVAHRARRRDTGQPRKAAYERIPGQILQMLQPTRTDVRQRHEQQGEPGTSVIAAERGAGGLQSARQIEPVHVAADQLQPAVRRQVLGDERDGQIPLDHLPQRAYAQAHQRGLRESRVDMGMSSLLIRGIAPLMLSTHAFAPSVISDWG